MRFHLDKEDENCLRDSEDGRVLCRTKREFQSLKSQIIRFEKLNEVKECKHDGGWVSLKKQTIWVNEYKDLIFGKSHDNTNSILCRCNKRTCKSQRIAYFHLDGRFYRYGKIIINDALHAKVEGEGK